MASRAVSLVQSALCLSSVIGGRRDFWEVRRILKGSLILGGLGLRGILKGSGGDKGDKEGI